MADKDKLDEVLKEMRKGFTGVNNRLDDMDKRLDGVDKRLEKIDKRLDNFDKNYLKTHKKDRERISELEESVGL